MPVLAVVLVLILAAWPNQWHLDRTGYWTSQIDWFITLNLALSAWPGQIWSNLTLLGDAAVLIVLLCPLLVWRPQAWAAMLGAAPVAAAIWVTGKYLAAMPRPAAVLDQQHFTVIGDTLSVYNSLPSGHMITVFAATIAVFATLIPQPRSGRDWSSLLAGLPVAAIVCLSRVAIGAHWPLDLLAGAAGGWIAGLSGAALAWRH